MKKGTILIIGNCDGNLNDIFIDGHCLDDDNPLYDEIGSLIGNYLKSLCYIDVPEVKSILLNAYSKRFNCIVLCTNGTFDVIKEDDDNGL